MGKVEFIKAFVAAGPSMDDAELNTLHEHIHFLLAELDRLREVAELMREEHRSGVGDYYVGGTCERILEYAEMIDGVHVKTTSEIAAEYLAEQEERP